MAKSFLEEQQSLNQNTQQPRYVWEYRKTGQVASVSLGTNYYGPEHINFQTPAAAADSRTLVFDADIDLN